MAGKSNKLYVIVDEEEGILLINMDRSDPKRPLVAATHTLAEIGSLSLEAAKAIGFATEFSGAPDADLRQNLQFYFDRVKFAADSGIKFCIGVEQTTAELSTSRRQQAYVDIGALSEVTGREA